MSATQDDIAAHQRILAVLRSGRCMCGGTGALGPDWDEYVCPWCQGSGQPR